MIKLILRIFPKKKLWEAIMDREGFKTTESSIEYVVWTEAFRKTPNLVKFLEKREIALLKTLALEDKSKDFILGQIYENRLWQRYDVPDNSVPKVEKEIEVKKVDKEKFLGIWKYGKKDKVDEPEGIKDKDS